MASGISSFSASGNKLAGKENIQINGPIAGNLNILRLDCKYPKMLLIREQKKKQDKCYHALFLTHPEADRGGICSRNGNRVKSTCEWIKEVKEIEFFEQRWGPGSKNFLWIQGGPGKGKTYLSMYLANRWALCMNLQLPEHLVLEYYCDNSNSQRNTSLCVLRSLLCQLLKAHSDLYEDILMEFEYYRQRHQSLVSNSHKENLWRIFKSMVSKFPKNILFILDGLDECDEDSIKFLKAKFEGFYGDTGERDRGKLKTVLVSRHLKDKVQAELYIDLDNLDHEYREKRLEDVKVFVSDSVGRIKGFEDHKENLKRLLLDRADGTFLWVGLAVRELNNDSRMLGEIISHPDSATTWLPKGLDDLYNRILLNIPKSRREISFKIIRCICTAMCPLKIPEIAMMIDATYTEVESHIRDLEHIITSVGGRFQFIHRSLTDHLRSISPLTSPILLSHLVSRFLIAMEAILETKSREFPFGLVFFYLLTIIFLNLARGLFFDEFFVILAIEGIVFCYSFYTYGSLRPLFLVRTFQQYLKIRAFDFQERKAHRELYVRCLVSMMKSLKMNGCEIKEFGTRIAEIDTEKKAKYLLRVEYPCRHWIDHFEKGNVVECDNRNLHNFLLKHFLHWLEAMSLMERFSDSIIAINSLESHTSHIENPALYAFVHDAKQFILHNQAGIEQAPLQIYSSALFFAPQKSIVRLTFQRCIPNWLYEISKKRSYWSSRVRILEGRSAEAQDVVAFSSDGTMVASGSRNAGTIQVWDVATGILLQKFENGENNGFFGFSPDLKLVAMSSNNAILLWETRTGKPYIFKARSEPTSSIVFSSDSKMMASGCDDGTILLWNAQANQSFPSPSELQSHSSATYRVVFSPNNEVLASISDDNTVRLWETKTGRLLHTFDDVICDKPGLIRFTADSKKVVVGDKDGTFWLWNSTTGYELLWTSDQPIYDYLKSVVFSPYRNMLAPMGELYVRLWNRVTGRSLQTLQDSRISCMALSPNGQMIAFGSDIGAATIRLRDTSGELLQILRGHSDMINSIVFSPDGTKLASCSNDGTTRLWNIRPIINKSPVRDNIKRVVRVWFSPNGRFVAAVYLGLKIRLWNVKTGIRHKLEAKPCLNGREFELFPVLFSPNDEIIASTDFYIITLFDTATGKVLHELKGFRDFKGMKMSWTFSPDSRIIIASRFGQCKLWDVQTGELLSTINIGDEDTPYLACSSNYRVLAACYLRDCEEISANLWDVKKGEFLRTMSSKKNDNTDLEHASLEFSSNDEFLRFQFSCDKAYVWNVATGNSVLPHENNAQFKTLSIPDRYCVRNYWIAERVDDGWREVLWLPHEYRATCTYSYRGIIALAYDSGKVFFLKIAQDDDEEFFKDVGAWGGIIDMGEEIEDEQSEVSEEWEDEDSYEASGKAVELEFDVNSSKDNPKYSEGLNSLLRRWIFDESEV
ncbi:hypothetical protein NHQ30_008134 [Ciborinia camelliae]|nr:hypothetical protein NHQ30_008134 [Ciborinia camelliae]